MDKELALQIAKATLDECVNNQILLLDILCIMEKNNFINDGVDEHYILMRDAEEAYDKNDKNIALLKDIIAKLREEF